MGVRILSISESLILHSLQGFLIQPFLNHLAALLLLEFLIEMHWPHLVCILSPVGCSSIEITLCSRPDLEIKMPVFSINELTLLLFEGVFINLLHHAHCVLQNGKFFLGHAFSFRSHYIVLESFTFGNEPLFLQFFGMVHENPQTHS